MSRTRTNKGTINKIKGVVNNNNGDNNNNSNVFGNDINDRSKNITNTTNNNINKVLVKKIKKKHKSTRAKEVEARNPEYGIKSRRKLNNFQLDSLKDGYKNNRPMLEHLYLSDDKKGYTFMGIVSEPFNKTDGVISKVKIVGGEEVSDHLIIRNNRFDDLKGSVVYFTADIIQYQKKNHEGKLIGEPKYGLEFKELKNVIDTYDTGVDHEVYILSRSELPEYNKLIDDFNTDRFHEILMELKHTNRDLSYKLFGDNYYLHELLRALLSLNISYKYLGRGKIIDEIFVVEMIDLYHTVITHVKANPKGKISDVIDVAIINSIAIHGGPMTKDEDISEDFMRYCLYFHINEKESARQSMLLCKDITNPAMFDEDIDLLHAYVELYSRYFTSLMIQR